MRVCIVCGGPATGLQCDGCRTGAKKPDVVARGTVADTRSEAEIRREIIAWCYARGAVHVTDAEQGYRPDRCKHCGGELGRGNATTRLDRGFPDLVVFWPAPRGVWWVEVKSAKGKQTDHQRQFEAWVRASGGVYLVVRDVADCESAWMPSPLADG